MTTVADTQKSDLSIVYITEKAAEKLKVFAQKQGIAEQFVVRAGVKGGGCSGLTYVLAIEKEATPEDKVVEQYGVKVCVDKKSYIFIAGMTLDFSDGLNGKGFTFYNPNAKKTCGCGTSFGV